MDPAEITDLLGAASAGDQAASKALFTKTYKNLKRIARGQIRRLGNEMTINPTTLVHEAYLKYARHNEHELLCSAHFYNLLGQVMRQILLDLAKKLSTSKHGKDFVRAELPEDIEGEQLPLNALLDIDDALKKLEACDTELARIVEWHFFAGLSFQEISLAIGSSERTARRQWNAARVFLLSAMHGGEAVSHE